jgi:hypothetical protein
MRSRAIARWFGCLLGLDYARSASWIIGHRRRVEAARRYRRLAIERVEERHLEEAWLPARTALVNGPATIARANAMPIATTVKA